MVDKIYIEQTELTPLIQLDYQNSVMRIKGISVPENAYEFFTPLFNWMDGYQLQPIEKGKFEFELEYFNTSSSKMLLEMMKMIQKLPNQTIVWTLYADDEDIIEVVRDYNELLGGIIQTNIIERNLFIQK